MKRRSKDSAYFRDWLEKAERDLSTAELNHEQGGYTDVTCYFSHQVAEKSLKAFLLWKKATELPRTHVLAALLSRCEMLAGDFAGLKDEVEKLDAYFIETKYPVLPAVDYPKEEAKEAIESAEKVLNFVKTSLPATPTTRSAPKTGRS